MRDEHLSHDDMVTLGLQATGNMDFETALRWYSRAAEAGDAIAAASAAAMYETGMGVRKNPGRALSLYRQAARGGLATAQEKIRSLYWKELRDAAEAVVMCALICAMAALWANRSSSDEDWLPATIGALALVLILFGVVGSVDRLVRLGLHEFWYRHPEPRQVRSIRFVSHVAKRLYNVGTAVIIGLWTIIFLPYAALAATELVWPAVSSQDATDFVRGLIPRYIPLSALPLSPTHLFQLGCVVVVIVSAAILCIGAKGQGALPIMWGAVIVALFLSVMCTVINLRNPEASDIHAFNELGIRIGGSAIAVCLICFASIRCRE